MLDTIKERCLTGAKEFWSQDILKVGNACYALYYCAELERREGILALEDSPMAQHPSWGPLITCLVDAKSPEEIEQFAESYCLIHNYTGEAAYEYYLYAMGTLCLQKGMLLREMAHDLGCGVYDDDIVKAALFFRFYQEGKLPEYTVSLSSLDEIDMNRLEELEYQVELEKLNAIRTQGYYSRFLRRDYEDHFSKTVCTFSDDDMKQLIGKIDSDTLVRALHLTTCAAIDRFFTNMHPRQANNIYWRMCLTERDVKIQESEDAKNAILNRIGGALRKNQHWS